MNNMIKTYNGLNNTPALPLAIDGWMYLRKRGFTENTLLLQWDHQAIVFHNKRGKPVGILVYQDVDYRKETFIILGYVLPKYRRRGIYKELFRNLKNICRKNGIIMIRGGLYLKNTPMLKVADSLGRFRESVISSYELGTLDEIKEALKRRGGI